jgi:diaminohydroxyphosphoribosylaminopyrimidine deaminase/5-amino-6-(5-phosphoribosylamino)uracil reductase
VVSPVDLAWMDRALRLAERGRGHTSPNPLVGAVLVDPRGLIVGDGWHRKAGTPHAEVHALDAAGPRARGATLYCTLEPCCHVGRTGPCVERIAAAGVARVLAATPDPNPKVAGGGFAYLRARGITVEVGARRRDAVRQNAAFFTFMREGRPFVIFKAAVSLDGRIAEAAGVRTTISGPAARRDVQRLRAEVDAIAVGSGTLAVDDPWLTVREVYRDRPVTRVVFDRRLRTSPAARVFGTLADGPVVVLTTPGGVAGRPGAAAALAAAGASVEVLDDGSVAAGIRRLGELGVASLLLEGGAELGCAAWDAGMIDRVRLYVAPRPLGAAGVPLLEGRPFAVLGLHDARAEPCGDDVLIEGDVHRLD